MFEVFQNFVEQEKLIDSDQKILLGISGGIDSVVMLHLFSKSAFNFSIAHCNFKLRGQESDEDHSFVKKLAQNHHVPFYSKSFDTLNYADEQSISIQMAARELRVKWFEEIISSKACNYYATAHHLDDQIETILNNFFRGTGIAGMHGILPKRENLIHPMLFCYRQQIESYAKQHRLKYRTDSSNEKTDYTRNQIRHQLIPVIKDIYPNYQKTITENIQRLKQVENIYKDHIGNEIGALIENKKGYIKLPIKKLLQLNSNETYLYEFIKSFGFNFSDAEDIINSIDSSSGKYFLSQTHKITKDRNDLIIERRIAAQPKKYTINKSDHILLNPIELKIHTQNITPDFEISKNPNIVNLDLTKLSFPLVLKKWQQGDYFYPLGMDQKKLVSDFFIDNKVPLPDKEKTWLLTSDENIIWIVGHRIDNRYKITAQTKSALTIEFVNKHDC